MSIKEYLALHLRETEQKSDIVYVSTLELLPQAFF